MESNARIVFSRQPARCLLVDISKYVDIDSLENLNSSLEQFFSVVSHLSGPVRVPYFGLFALGNYPEALFPLQNIKGNFSRLLAAIRELKTLYTDRATSDKECSAANHTSITQGILEAINMYQRQTQGYLRTSGYWSQLELCVMTGSNPFAASRQIEKALKQVDVDTLKKVSLVCMNNPDKLPHLSDENLTGSQGSSHSNTSTSSEQIGIIEVSHIDHDSLSIENLLRGWLHDASTDMEHLHISMPSKVPGEKLQLKCDLQEVVVNPAMTQYTNRFVIQSEGLVPNNVLNQNNNSKVSNYAVPIHSLTVVKTLDVAGICESVLYGMPLIVRATSCWKIDWDELETNQQNFLGLCHVLQENNQALLAKLDKVGDNSSKNQSKSRLKSSFRYSLPVEPPSGYFLLLPSQSGTLLLKSIAVRELMLPRDVHTEQTPDHTVLARIKAALEQVTQEDCYNPLLYESGLSQNVLKQMQDSNMVPAPLHPNANYNVKPSNNRNTQQSSKRKLPVGGPNSTASTIARQMYQPASNLINSTRNQKWNQPTTVSKQSQFRNQRNVFYSLNDDDEENGFSY